MTAICFQHHVYGGLIHALNAITLSLRVTSVESVAIHFITRDCFVVSLLAMTHYLTCLYQLRPVPSCNYSIMLALVRLRRMNPASFFKKDSRQAGMTYKRLYLFPNPATRIVIASETKQSCLF